MAEEARAAEAGGARRATRPRRSSATTSSRSPASASRSRCAARPRRRRQRRRAGRPHRRPSASARAAGGGGGGGDALTSPLQGNVFKVLVEQGAEVEEGALICIIEAMKMENEITAHKAGTVAELPISEGRRGRERRHARRDQVSAELDALIHEAADWLRIPSISAGARNDEALREAAEWAQRRVLEAGGTCELVDTARRRAAGRRRAARGARGRADGADLRPLRRAGPGRRGRLDDAAVRARHPRRPPVRARRRRRQGQLPAAAARRVRDGRRRRAAGATCACWSRAPRRPAPTTSTSGCSPTSAAPTARSSSTPGCSTPTRRRSPIAHARHRVRRARGPHRRADRALGRLRRRRAERLPRAARGRSAAVLPGPDGRLPEPLRAGVEPPTAEELADWDALPGGADRARRGRRAAGRRDAPPPSSTCAPAADASLDVHRIRGGEPRTIVPPVARLRPLGAAGARPGPADDRGGARGAAARARCRTAPS